MAEFSRRDVLVLAAATALTGSKSTRAFAQRTDSVTPFSTAVQMLEALRARRVSAVEQAVGPYLEDRTTLHFAARARVARVRSAARLRH